MKAITKDPLVIHLRAAAYIAPYLLRGRRSIAPPLPAGEPSLPATDDPRPRPKQRPGRSSLPYQGGPIANPTSIYTIRSQHHGQPPDPSRTTDQRDEGEALVPCRPMHITIWINATLQRTQRAPEPIICSAACAGRLSCLSWSVIATLLVGKGGRGGGVHAGALAVTAGLAGGSYR